MDKSDPHSTTAKVLVSDMMTSEVHRVKLDMKVADVIDLLTRHMISGAPVVDNIDTVVSVISEGDLLRLAATEGLQATIASCLTKLPAAQRLITVEKHQTFTDAYKLFLKHSLHRILVVDGNGKLHGLVTRADVLRLFVEARYGRKVKRNPAV